jgi:hypothetical protein
MAIVMSKFLWAILRGLMAWLATPALLLAALALAIDWWIATPRQAMTGGCLSRWWVAVDVAAALVGVAALDLLVEAF